jgi:purine nucleosidase/pyrimidine-specific ribonucleoside hydrolase
VTVPIVLDCDPGHDDAFAILLAAGSPLADLRAITTVGGNGTLEAVTENTLRVCTLAGIRDVPIAAGAAGPLRGELETAADVHGASGLDGPDLPVADIDLDPRPATELLADVLRGAGEPVTVVATGPITNVALLLEQAPDVREHIREVVWMGGSRGRGNRTPYAEFNAWVDPEAAEIVVGSGVPFTLVGLHLTHQALATPAVVERIRGVGGVLGDVAADWLGFFSSTYRAIWGFDAPLHDPCALAIALDPSLATWEDAFLAIETQGRWTRGATVVDPYGRLGREPNARVPLDIDVERFWAMLVSAIGAVGAATA